MKVATGDVEPRRLPRKTRASTPGACTVGGAWCSKAGAVSRCASGSATHSCAPWSSVVPGVDTSE
ncbi:hypothetical protein [Nocardioides zeae]